MDLVHTTSILPWTSPTLNGWKSGHRLAIVSTGPSYDLIDTRDLAGLDVFAINTAVTELHPLACTQNVFWIVHDLWKIWKHNFRKRIAGYDHWDLVTRRVYLPGRAGDVHWTNPDHSRNTSRFPWRMNPEDVNRSRIFWYTELADLEGYALSQETTLEVALEVATFWGYEKIVLVGADMGPAEGRPYANPWKWKHCYIRPDKFARMRLVITKNRERWPAGVYTISPHWTGPFTRIESLQEFKGIA